MSFEMKSKIVGVWIAIAGVILCVGLIEAHVITYFEGANFNGQRNSLDMEPGVCYNLAYFDKRISSVNTGGECLLVYQDACCSGEVARITLGEVKDGIKQCLSHNDLAYNCDMSDKISSIQLCRYA